MLLSSIDFLLYICLLFVDTTFGQFEKSFWIFIFSLDAQFLLEDYCLFAICILLNIRLPTKFQRDINVLRVKFLKVYTSLN